MTSEREILGFRLSDLLGVIIMIIPFLISILFKYTEEGISFWFIQLSSDKTTSIRPGLISAVCAVIFYASFITRYDGMFRAKNLFETLVSIVRAFLNCWVIASIISTVVPTTIPEKSSTLSVFFNNPESTLLLLAILLSWLGMKTIAGYSWVLFIVAAWKHLLIVNSTMDMWGAVFVLTFAISLFLQVKDYTVMRDFMQEFRGKAMRVAASTSMEINAAANDALKKAHNVTEFVKENVSAYTDIVFSSSEGSVKPAKVKLNLEALDLNKDGVVDEKDFMVLQQKNHEGGESSR